MNIISDVLGGDIVPPRLAVGSLPPDFPTGIPANFDSVTQATTIAFDRHHSPIAQVGPDQHEDRWIPVEMAGDCGIAPDGTVEDDPVVRLATRDGRPEQGKVHPPSADVGPRAVS